jgi:hypothetical protein
MVKSFATKARVIALDIQDFPPELERCMWLRHIRVVDYLLMGSFSTRCAFL